MSDWGWIAFGYTVVYGLIAAYGAALLWRRRRALARLAGSDVDPRG